MAIKVKDVGTISTKFVQRAQTAGPDYTAGVQNAGADWAANAKASESNYEAGVQQSIADKRYGKGIDAAGSQKYVTRASQLGSQRYPTGVAASQADYSKGVQPYLQAIASLDLPPRRPKGDPANQARANAVAVALRRVKVGK